MCLVKPAIDESDEILIVQVPGRPRPILDSVWTALGGPPPLSPPQALCFSACRWSARSGAL